MCGVTQRLCGGRGQFTSSPDCFWGGVELYDLPEYFVGEGVYAILNLTFLRGGGICNP